MFFLPVMVSIIVMFFLLFLSVIAVIPIEITGTGSVACREAGGDEDHGEEKQQQKGCVQSV